VAKQPKLVLRESCVHDMTADWPPGRFVEMGAGTGGMTRLFLQRQFTGVCHDLGEDSRQMMRDALAHWGGRIQVVDSVNEMPDGGFDYLLAFEVLEHIANDQEVLNAWSTKLRDGGRLIVSVPAHAKKFGRSDELVGHVRRYEKQQLHGLLRAAGYTDIRIVNYGFPITEFTRRFSNYLVRNDQSYTHLDSTQRSILSAQAKPKVVANWLKLISGQVVSPFCRVQRWFYGHDWGDGYVATAARVPRLL
jgi:SAM-dependent methyltransferase